MYELLKYNFRNLEEIYLNKMVQIIEHLVLNLWDADVFKNYFGFDIDFSKEEHMINVAQFNQCLRYLQVNEYYVVFEKKYFIIFIF